MADIAVIFHWPPRDLWKLSLSELIAWHDRAVTRFKLIKGLNNGRT